MAILPTSAPALDTDDWGDTGDAAITLPMPEDPSFVGSATYRYPIDVPPGRNGMTPRIILTYNGQKKSSGLGLGWDLDVGYIQRSTKWGLDYNGTDFIASFNGNIMELVRRPDWDTGGNTCYGAKIEGAFARFCHSPSDAWVATGKDGTIYRYGTDATSQQDFRNTTTGSRIGAFKWCLDRVQDTNGNYMTLSYNKDYFASGGVAYYGEIYLYRIDYTGNGSIGTTNYISFNWSNEIAPPSPKPVMYTTKNKVQTSRQLASINVYAGNQPVRNYVLQYDQDTEPSGPRLTSPLLTKITPYGNDFGSSNPHHLPPTTLYYQPRTGSFYNPIPAGDFSTPSDVELDNQEAPAAYLPVWNTNLHLASRWKGWNVTGDFNGDGRTDILTYVDRTGSTSTTYQTIVRIHLSTGNGFIISDDFALTPAGRPIALDASTAGAFRPKLWVGDFDGDGKSDIATIDGDGKIYVYRSTGTGFEPAALWNAFDCVLNNHQRPKYATCANPGNSKFTRVGDFNGDGKADMVSWINGSNGDQILMFISTGNSFTDQRIDSDIINNPYFGPLMWLGDFDGDGKTDIAAWSSSQTAIKMHLSDGPKGQFTGFKKDLNTTYASHIPSWQSNITNSPLYGPLLWLGDFNGDGKTDIAGWKLFGNGSVLTVHLSTGADKFDIQEWTLPTALQTNPKYGPWLGDFNGDGRTDLAVWKISGKVHIYLSKGSGFLAEEWLSKFYMDPNYGVTMWLGDFNGDGRTDIAAWKYGQAGNQVYMHMPGGDHPDLLSTVQNGIGGTTNISYQPSSVWPLSTAYADYGVPFIVQTMAFKTVDDGNGVVSTTTYSYAGPYYDRQEREFYGFAYVVTGDPSFASATETWYKQKKVEAGGIKSMYKGRIYAQDTGNGHWTWTNGVFDVDCQGAPCPPPQGYFGRWAPSALYKTVQNTYDYSSTAAADWAFPFLKQQDVFTCDGHCAENPLSGYQQTTTAFEYDIYGNLTSRYFKGESATGDERYEHTDYNYAVCNDASKRILNRPGMVWTTDLTGTVKSKSWLEYDHNNPSTCKGNLTKKTDLLSGGTNPITSYDYDSFGNRTTVIDPMNITTMTTYDTDTNTYPQTKTYAYPSSYTVQKTWDYRYGKPHTETDFNNQTTTYIYDAFGRISKVIKPLDSDSYPTKAYTYENLGTVGSQKVRVLTRTDGTAATWSETYFDGLGRPIMTKKQGPGTTPIVINRAYDARGLLWGQSLPYFDGDSLHWTTYEYDPLKRINRLTRPDGSYETSEYDRGRTTLIDANGHKKVKETDGLGRLVRVEEYIGNEASNNFALYAYTTYRYDPLGNLLQTTDVSGNATSMLYDTLSRKYQMTDPDMGTWHYEYWPNGNLKYQTDAKGQTIYFEYDNLNRVHQKTYIGSSATPVIYTHDEVAPDNYANGKLTTVSDASGSTRFVYDQRGRTKSTTKSFLDGTSYTIQTAYDSRDRVKSITYPGSSPETVNYVYDTAGNLTNIQSTATNYATYYDFNARGQAGNVWYGNNVVHTQYTYDIATTRLTDIVTEGNGGLRLQDLHYDYDDVGNILTITGTETPTNTQAFQYDELNRLRYADSPAYGSIEYRYDTIGNMTFNSRVGDYTYNPSHPHAVYAAGTNTYSYDFNGNMTGGEARTFAWDYDNRPTSINGVAMVYDYQGQRTKKGSTKYIGKLYECTGSTCTLHIMAGRNRIAKKTGTTVNFYRPDHLGSSSIVTDGTGNKVEEVNYYPYGATRTDTGSISVRHKYTGQEWDSETGLYYYGARYYHPVIGRFISADTKIQDFTQPQALNTYSYALNNPFRYVDPTGHYAEFQVDGNNVAITIPVAFTGLYQTPEAVDAYIRQIESTLSGQFGQYNVTTQVTFAADGTPREKYNVIEIGPLDPGEAKGFPFASDVGGNYAKLGELNAASMQWTDYRYNLLSAPHEILHLLGLADEYDPATRVPYPGCNGPMAWLGKSATEQEVRSYLTFALETGYYHGFGGNVFDLSQLQPPQTLWYVQADPSYYSYQYYYDDWSYDWQGGNE